MACVGGAKLTELEFVQGLNGHPVEICLGPVVNLLMVGYQLGVIEDALDGTADHEHLWENYVTEDHGYLTFGMCAFHWMNLCFQLRWHGLFFGRHNWVTLSLVMLAQVSRRAGLDPKEISNLLIWRRATLT